MHGPGAATRYILTRRRIAAWEIRAPPHKTKIVLRGPRSVGAWGKTEQGKVALMGQVAAHGQITERKYSVARMAMGRRNRYPVTDAASG
jgi:hypothetical protein